MSFRPTEDIVEQDLDNKKQWVNTPITKDTILPCPAIKMVRGDNASALAFCVGHIRALKKQGFVIDMIYLKKEVMN